MKLGDYLNLVGMTDAAFASRLGVDRSTVTRWRHGKAYPDFPNQMRIYVLTGRAVAPNDFLPDDLKKIGIG